MQVERCREMTPRGSVTGGTACVCMAVPRVGHFVLRKATEHLTVLVGRCCTEAKACCFKAASSCLSLSRWSASLA